MGKKARLLWGEGHRNAPVSVARLCRVCLGVTVGPAQWNAWSVPVTGFPVGVSSLGLSTDRERKRQSEGKRETALSVKKRARGSGRESVVALMN